MKHWNQLQYQLKSGVKMELVIMLAGAAIVYLAFEAIYRKLWLKGLSAEIGFSNDYITPGETTYLYEIVTNRKWMPLHFINVKFQLDRSISFKDENENSAISDKLYKNDLFSLMFYQKITRKIPVICKKRGYFTIDSIEIISSGLFMNDISSVTMPVETQLVVFPKESDIRIDVPFRKIMGSVLTNKYTYEDPFEFKGIRDYQIYDTMDKINWKATAKTGDLKVNLHDFTSSQEVCILLNLEDETMIKYENLLEESISIAASLIRYLVEAGVSTCVFSNGKDVITDENMEFYSGCGLNHINAINMGLARINLKRPVEDFFDLINCNSAKMPGNAIYVLISSCRNKKIRAMYNQIREKNSGSIWIVPHHAGMDLNSEESSHSDIISWEVPYYD